MTAVLKVDKLTWRPVERFGTVAEAADAAGVGWRYVYQMAREQRLPRGRYAYRFEDCFDPAERIRHRHNEPVDVADERTGRRWRVASKAALAESLDVPYSTVCTAFKTGGLLMGRFRLGRAE